MSSKTAARCFILSDTAYATNFNNNVIILDILEDQYITLNEKASDVLRTILTKKNPALSDEETDIINQLLGINLLKKSIMCIFMLFCYT